MAKADLPTPEQLRKLLRYEPDTGKLFWLERGPEWFSHCERPRHERTRWNNRFAGQEALTATNARGYKIGSVRVAGLSNLSAHRAAWALYHGVWPNGMLDHANGDKTDNRLENLSVVDKFGNARNQKRHSRNTSGVNGVHWCKARNRWQATIFANGVTTYLGNFKCKDEATLARSQAEARLGFHPNHGRE